MTAMDSKSGWLESSPAAPVADNVGGKCGEIESPLARFASETDWCPLCEHNPSTGHYRECELGKPARPSTERPR
jgi:hypothetical protein